MSISGVGIDISSFCQTQLSRFLPANSSEEDHMMGKIQTLCDPKPTYIFVSVCKELDVTL
jgi:hypothetical protein